MMYKHAHLKLCKVVRMSVLKLYVLLSTEENNCTILYVILLFRPSLCMKRKLLTPVPSRRPSL